MDRRDFLHTATIGAAVGVAPHANAQDADEHDHQAPPSDLTLRVKALESLLVEKGLVDPAALDAIIETIENKSARATERESSRARGSIPTYKHRLLANAPAAIAELGYTSGRAEHMVAIENTARVHNLVVCTLCSCYPWTMLGLPPVWYKSHAYRSRAVIDPRGVLREFGTELGDDVEVRVWDSTAELRYLVIPERPPGTENMTEKSWRHSSRATRSSASRKGCRPQERTHERRA